MGSKMFLSAERGRVASISEKPLISRILKNFGSAAARYPEGAGDDCAVLQKKNFSKRIFATTDAVISGIHFDEKSSARLVGRKLLARNASDIAAMGGLPKYALVAAQFSKNLSLKWLDEFCRGAGKEAAELGIKIVGGDVAHVLQESFFSAQMTLIGDANKRALLRRGASCGDSIFATGSLGLSFESGKHLTFTPRLAEGEFLASSKYVSACTDLSDGLASDLKNLLPDGTCAEITHIPSRKWRGRLASTKEALCGGEDYELLFTLGGTLQAKRNFLSRYKKRFGAEPIEVGRIARAKSAKEREAIVIVEDSAQRCVFFGEGYSH